MDAVVHAALGDARTIELADADEAVELLARMNGESVFELALRRGSDDLLFAGGADGWFQILMSVDDVTSQFDAEGRHGKSGRVTMITGGQRVAPKLETCVTFQEAEAVIRAFVAHGSRSPVVSWRRVF